MTDLPYTDDDLRTEAARQHADLIKNSDEGCVGDGMERGWVPSVETEEDGSGRTWAELLEPEGDDTEEFRTAQQKIHGLITGAADTSDWAVDLGAERLQPDEHTIQLGVDPDDGNRPRVRMHFAFHPGMEQADRDQFVVELSQTISESL